MPQISFSNGYQQTGANDWIPTKEYNNVWDFIQNVAHEQGLTRAQIRRRVPHRSGSRSSRCPILTGTSATARTKPPFRLTTKGSTGAAINTVTGDPIASALLGQIDSGDDLDHQLHFLAEDRLGMVRAGRLEGDSEADPEHRSSATSCGRRSTSASAGRRTSTCRRLTLYIPKGPNQDAPLPPNFATAFPTVKVSRGQVPSTLVPWDKYDFGPRIGFAYQVMQKTVIRAGFGMFYGGEENQGGSPNRGEGVPFNETVNLTRTSGVSTSSAYRARAAPVATTSRTASRADIRSTSFTLPAPVSVPRRPVGLPQSAGAQMERHGAARTAWRHGSRIGYEGNHQAHQVILWNSDPCREHRHDKLGDHHRRRSAYIQPPAGCTTCRRSATDFR